jgi:hypothetical protein
MYHDVNHNNNKKDVSAGVVAPVRWVGSWDVMAIRKVHRRALCLERAGYVYEDAERCMMHLGVCTADNTRRLSGGVELLYMVVAVRMLCP